MRLLKYMCFMVMMIVTTSLFAASDPVAVAKLSDLLNHFTTFQAHFKQETLSSNQDIIQKSEGDVKLMRPGYFHWESQLPTHQIVIADGRTLWVYDVDLQQVTQQPIQKGPMSPAKLLSGHVNATLQQFNVHMISHPKMTVFQLIPKKRNQQFRSIAIAFDEDELRSMRIKNNMLQTNAFYFSKVKINAPLSPSLFEFKVPAGVDVLH